jgi:hypothetical protein
VLAGSVFCAVFSVACGSSGDAPKNELGQGQTLTVASDKDAIATKISAEAGHYA